MNNHHARKNTRLKEFDYSQNGAYFITICSNEKRCTLTSGGDPCGRPNFILSKLGEICERTFNIIEEKYNEISVNKYIIMPNHIHFILIISNQNMIPIGKIIGAYKSLVSNAWLKICKQNNEIMGQIWQRNYYDHIIRDDIDYKTKWKYIDTNPIRWREDEYYT